MLQRVAASSSRCLSRTATCRLSARPTVLAAAAAFPERPASVRPLTACTRGFHSSMNDLDSDLDDICSKHMELPADEFAMGCGFLHQVALGNKSELERMLSQHAGIGESGYLISCASVRGSFSCVHYSIHFFPLQYPHV